MAIPEESLAFRPYLGLFLFQACQFGGLLLCHGIDPGEQQGLFVQLCLNLLSLAVELFVMFLSVFPGVQPDFNPGQQGGRLPRQTLADPQRLQLLEEICPDLLGLLLLGFGLFLEPL